MDRDGGGKDAVTPSGGVEDGIYECLESAPEYCGRVELSKTAAENDPPTVEDVGWAFFKRRDGSR
ncbi:MAG: hypothetical protein OXC83_04330 [Chloroflexi bacterium]|nr:hypothetical protein [Chloroflexota bacterium]